MNDIAPQSQQHPVVRFKSDLKKMIDAKELALPSNVSIDAFRNAAIVAVQDNPEILRCDAASVMKSIRTIAAAGLVPDGREAAIVPFSGKAQAMPMVFGLIKMARRSGDVRDIRAHIVYQRELDEGRFDYVVGDEERLVHQPVLFGDKGDPVAAYAIGKLKDGTIVREFMDAAQIDKIRRSSPQQRKHDKPNGIWQQWSEEMWKKTVIRRLCKRLDLSAEDLRRLMVEEDAPEPIRDVTPQEPRQNLAAKLAEQEAPKDVSGEVMDDAHWTDGVPWDGAFPGADEYTEGAKAFQNGEPVTACPYESDEAKAVDWCGGWHESRLAKGGDK
jgi:recombination protein RecT